MSILRAGCHCISYPSVCFFLNLVSKPHCAANLSEGQYTVEELTSLQITCGISYVGNLLPVFRCQPSAGQQPQQFISSQSDVLKLGENVVTTRTVTFVYVHVINVIRQLSGTSLTCTMEFNYDPISVANPQVYDFTWKSDPLVVTCEFITPASSALTGVVSCFVVLHKHINNYSTCRQRFD